MNQLSHLVAEWYTRTSPGGASLTNAAIVAFLPDMIKVVLVFNGIYCNAVQTRALDIEGPRGQERHWLGTERG